MFKEKENRIGEFLLLLIPFIYVLMTFQHSGSKTATSDNAISATLFITSSPIEMGELKLPERSLITTSVHFLPYNFNYSTFNKSLVSLNKLILNLTFKGKNLFLLTYFSKAP